MHISDKLSEKVFLRSVTKLFEYSSGAFTIAEDYWRLSKRTDFFKSDLNADITIYNDAFNDYHIAVDVVPFRLCHRINKTFNNLTFKDCDIPKKVRIIGVDAISIVFDNCQLNRQCINLAFLVALRGIPVITFKNMTFDYCWFDNCMSDFIQNSFVPSRLKITFENCTFREDNKREYLYKYPLVNYINCSRFYYPNLNL